jgi:hypothetical protein
LPLTEELDANITHPGIEAKMAGVIKVLIGNGKMAVIREGRTFTCTEQQRVQERCGTANETNMG